MRHYGRYLLELAQQGAFVGALQRRAVLRAHERGHGGHGRGKADLEAHVFRDHAVRLEVLEERVRVFGRLGVTELPELDAGRVHALVDGEWAYVEARQLDGLRPDAAEAGRHVEHGALEEDPVEALARLAVRDGVQLGAAVPGGGAEDGGGAV